MIEFDYPLGATPLDYDSLHLLIPKISIQAELNDFEARNIAAAIQWAEKSSKLKNNLMSIAGLTLLHKRMFNFTWSWAGKFRKSNTNIGSPWELIQGELKALCDDIRYQLEHQVYPLAELAVRFHHRLVLIHPFPNGNGRHARLAADLLLRFNHQPQLVWGGKSLDANSNLRQHYITAMRQADKGDYAPLMEFCLKAGQSGKEKGPDC